MQVHIKDKKDEPLLARKMIMAEIEFENATPPYGEITTALASNLKSDEKLVAIRHVYTSFGKKHAKITAYVYNDEAKRLANEPKLKVKKDPKAKKEEKK